MLSLFLVMKLLGEIKYLSICEGLLNCFTKYLQCFIFWSVIYENSKMPAPSSTSYFYLLSLSSPGGYEALSHLVLFCIPLMNNNNSSLSVDICIYYFKKCLFKSFAPVKQLSSTHWVLLINSEYKLFVGIWYANISLLVDCLKHTIHSNCFRFFWS